MEKTIYIKEKCRFCHINSTIEWNYANDFLLALCNVDKGYYMYPVKTKKGKNEYKYPERVFAYEFYHQYRKVMEDKQNVYSGLYLNGEQTKDRKVADYIGDYTPDLILHKSLDGMYQESQKWLCEIKMMNSINPLSDIEKFRKMNQLCFDDHIFLYAGSCLANLLKKIQYKIKKGVINKEFDGSCICICSCYGRTSRLHIECHRLSTLIDMIEGKDMKSLKKQMIFSNKEILS